MATTRPAAKSPARKAVAAKKPTPRKAATPTAARKPTAPAKTSAAPAVKAAEKVAAPATASKVKAAKKPKLVRDSFTMPKDEYQAIDSLKQRATRLHRSAKKSELLRAGIMALAAMGDQKFVAILAQVPALKTGRPAKA